MAVINVQILLFVWFVRLDIILIPQLKNANYALKNLNNVNYALNFSASHVKVNSISIQHLKCVKDVMTDFMVVNFVIKLIALSVKTIIMFLLVRQIAHIVQTLMGVFYVIVQVNV